MTIINNKWWDYVQSLVFFSAITIVGYAFVRIYFDRAHAPAGVCPVNSYQWIINIGTGLMVVYLLMSMFEWIIQRKNKQKGN